MRASVCMIVCQLLTNKDSYYLTLSPVLQELIGSYLTLSPVCRCYKSWLAVTWHCRLCAGVTRVDWQLPDTVTCVQVLQELIGNEKKFVTVMEELQSYLAPLETNDEMYVLYAVIIIIRSFALSSKYIAHQLSISKTVSSIVKYTQCCSRLSHCWLSGKVFVL